MYNKKTLSVMNSVSVNMFQIYNYLITAELDKNDGEIFWRFSSSYFNIVAITRETIAISLSKMLIEGPLVSLRGSPTVSPTTAAL